MWNFNNGQLLKEFASGSSLEISNVLYINEVCYNRNLIKHGCQRARKGGLQCIVAAGWNRRIIVWEEGDDSNEPIEPIVTFSGGSVLPCVQCDGLKDSLCIGMMMI